MPLVYIQLVGLPHAFGCCGPQCGVVSAAQHMMVCLSEQEVEGEEGVGIWRLCFANLSSLPIREVQRVTSSFGSARKTLSNFSGLPDLPFKKLGFGVLKKSQARGVSLVFVCVKR
eukprot:659706-Pelagomonas_calceolata.AAC.1